MNRVQTQSFPSESRLFKRERYLLWALLVLQFAFLILQDWRNEQVKARITPQSVMDACQGAIK